MKRNGENDRPPIAKDVVFGGRGYATVTRAHLAPIASIADQKDDKGGISSVLVNNVNLRVISHPKTVLSRNGKGRIFNIYSCTW